jgi:hypothetical protein
MKELDDLHLYRVKCSAIELPTKSRDIDLVICLIKLLYPFLYSLNIVRLHYRTYLFLMVVSYRIIDDLVYFPSSSSPIN